MDTGNLDIIYKFQNDKLNYIWQHYPSIYTNNNKDFQRMEFLGDRIIAFYIADILFKQKAYLSDNQMSINLLNLVSMQCMAKIAKKYLIQYIHADYINDKILCNCLEAYIGCIYIDGGAIKKIIYFLWKRYIYKKFLPNVKNILQELAQKHQLTPQYSYKAHPINKKIFICFLSCGKYHCEAEAFSKKKASILAANRFLNKFPFNNI